MRKLWRLGALILLLAVLTGCSVTPDEHLWLKSPGWSRALFLGRTGISAPVAVHPDGQDVYALFLPFDRETDTYRLRLAHFSIADNSVAYLDYALTLSHRPLAVDLFRLDEGWRFFWLDGETLFTAVSDADGKWLEAPHALHPDMALNNFVVISRDGDWVVLAGGTRRVPGIYAFLPNDEVVTLADDGVWVRAMPDLDGNLHVAWALYPPGYARAALYYGVLPAAADWSALTAHKVQDLRLSTSVRLDGLALGVDDTHVYMIWTTNTVAGLEAGTVETLYTSAPLGGLPDGVPQDVYVPMTYDGVFDAPAPTDLLTGGRVDLRSAPFAPNNALHDLAVSTQPASELVMAYRSEMLHLWRKMRFQVNVLYWDDGEPAYSQPLSFTSTYSLSPSIALGNDGALYITWLEKIVSDDYSVYFASTHPQVVADMASMTWNERLDVTFQTLFGMLIGALLAPLAASVWMLAPLFVFLLLGFVRRWAPPSWGTAWDYLTLGFSLLAFWAAKRATLPGMLDYVPFSAWIPDIPSLLGLILRFAVPILIAALSIFVAWHYTYRRGNRASLYFLMIYIGVDALLSTAIYAVLIYGVF